MILGLIIGFVLGGIFGATVWNFVKKEAVSVEDTIKKNTP